MLYYSLAESYNELDWLITVIKTLENTEVGPSENLRQRIYLRGEIERIKASASRDILIFGPHAQHYINFHLRIVYELMLNTIAINNKLSEQIFLNTRQKYVFQYCNDLRDELRELSEFYETL